MSLLGFLLLLGLTTQQDQPAVAQSSGDWMAKPVFSASQFNIDQLRPQTESQGQPAGAQSSGDWVAKPVFSASQFDIARLRQLQQRRIQQALDNARQAAREAAQMPTCYAIKSYIFEREDGNAPVLVATTTCTPASTLQWRQVDRAPKVRLIPAR